MKENKLTPEELHKKLMEYHTSTPVIMEDDAFSENLKDTVVQRYKVGNEYLEEVAATLREIKKKNPDIATEIDKSINKIDQAVNMMSYGHLGYNKAATGKPRAILWPKKK